MASLTIVPKCLLNTSHQGSLLLLAYLSSASNERVLSMFNSMLSTRQAHFGSLTFLLVTSMFGSAQPVMTAIPYERPMFLREYESGTCKCSLRLLLLLMLLGFYCSFYWRCFFLLLLLLQYVSLCIYLRLLISPLLLLLLLTDSVFAYLLSKMSAELPLSFLSVMIQFLICYFMFGLRGNFILLVLAAWGLALCSNSAALCIGSFTKNVKVST